MTSAGRSGRRRQPVPVGPGSVPSRPHVPVVLEPMSDVDVVEVTIGVDHARARGFDLAGRDVSFETSPHQLIKVAELLANGRPSVRIRVGTDGIHPLETAKRRP